MRQPKVIANIYEKEKDLDILYVSYLGKNFLTDRKVLRFYFLQYNLISYCQIVTKISQA